MLYFNYFFFFLVFTGAVFNFVMAADLIGVNPMDVENIKNVLQRPTECIRNAISHIIFNLMAIECFNAWNCLFYETFSIMKLSLVSN
jgi:hypothetical protein